MGQLKPGIYRHYKGNLYQVIGLAMHSETSQKMVVYKALYNCPDLWEEYGKDSMFVRPYDMFIEDMTVDGKQVPRFDFVKEGK